MPSRTKFIFIVLILFQYSNTKMNTIHAKSKYIMGFVSFPDLNAAKSIARILVNERLVACAKVMNNIDSFYIYEDKFQEEKEVYMIIKTKSDKIDEIKNILNKDHPYKVYEFLYHEVEVGNPKYMRWVDEMVDGIKYDI